MSKLNALRTPEERFARLPFFPWAPRYQDDLPGYEGLRLHYLDEGPKDAREVFLCLHGEPTWAYQAYTYSFHRNTALRLLERLDLRSVTLVCQDWGGLLGLTLPMEMPERFRRLLVMNTGIPVGKPVSDGFAAWKAFAGAYHDIPVSGLVALSSPGALNPYDVAAYDAPFPDASYKAGVRRFPQLVAVEPGMEGVAYGERARRFLANDWRGESFMAIGLRATIRGCPPALEVADAGHFVQEWGEPIARKALAAFGLAAKPA